VFKKQPIVSGDAVAAIGLKIGSLHSKGKFNISHFTTKTKQRKT
jgi:hypothetical protein